MAAHTPLLRGPPITTPAIPPVTLLQVEGLNFNYPQRALLNDFSVQIPAGVSLLRGGDGVGKSTLLRLLAGDLPAQGGQLTVNHISLSEQPEAYRQQVFWTDPRSEAFDQLSPDAYFASVQARYPQFDRLRLAGLIEGLALTPHMGKTLYMLSTGLKRKVWLAAAFASGAALTLLDEPFAALDKSSINFVLQQLQALATHPTRAWLFSHYDSPDKLALAALIDLGD